MRIAIVLLCLLLALPAWGQTVINGTRVIRGDLSVDGDIDIGTIETFTDTDATPDVSDGSYFDTFTNALTITDFDGTPADGDMIVVNSQGAITYDCTGAGFDCGTTDIVTAAGDTTMWVYDGTDWNLIAFAQQSDNLGVDAGAAGGDSVSIDSVAVVDPDFVSTGQVDFTDTANTVTADINDDTILEADLKAVDAAGDEECLTFEATGGDFEWQSCASETNDLEADDPPNVANTEVYIGTGAGTGAWAVLSSDVTMDNTGAVTIGADTVALTTDTTGNYAAGDAEAGDALVATTVTITDNESTAENNPIVFVAGADPDGGNLGLESDGTTYYTPSTGVVTATGFVGALTGAVTGNADTATALAANGGNCNAGELMAGVDASGAVESCDATPAIDCTDCTNIPGGSTHTGTVTWGGTSLLESGAAFQFGDGTDATVTHTYGNTGTDVVVAYSTAVANYTTGELQQGGSAVVLDSDIGSTVQTQDAELDTIAALTETNGGVMFVAGGVWTTDTTPAIDCTDCTNTGGTTLLVAPYRDNSAAGLTDTLMLAWAGAGAIRRPFVMPRAGSVTDVTCYTSTGSASEANAVCTTDPCYLMELYIEYADSTSTDCEIDNGTSDCDITLSANNTFSAGDKVILRVTTPADLTSTTVDVICSVWGTF